MKKLISLAIAIILSLSVTSCASQKNKNTLVVGASPAPHAEILEQVKPILEKEGIILEIKEFTDYVIPNTALNDGSLDANYFQHQPYLIQFNEANKTDLISAGSIHFEPLGIYPGKSADISSLTDGASIAIPNDVTNGARALLLLQENGILTLSGNKGLESTVLDIDQNPKNVKIEELAAEMIPSALQDVDLAVINGNYAIGAGINKTVLASEDPKGSVAQDRANIIAVQKGNENEPKIQALITALCSDEIRKFIETKYEGSVVPVF